MLIPPPLTLAVVLLNGLAVLGGVVLIGLGTLYAPDDWDIDSTLMVVVALFPCFAALAASRRQASRFARSVAVGSAACWLAVIVLAGAVVSTGVGGLAGTLLLMVPGAALLLLNCLALNA